MSKEYFIRICSLEWGLVEREAINYKEALALYAHLKEKYKDIPCLVQLISVTIENDIETEKVLHEKEIGQHNDPIYHVNKILEHVKALSSAEDALNSIAAQNTTDMNKYCHGIELSVLRRASAFNKLQLLEELEDIATMRRQAKLVHNDISEISKNIKELLENIKSAKTILHAAKNKRVQLNQSLKNNNYYDKYLNVLGLEDKDINKIANPQYYIPKYIEEEEHVNGIDIEEEATEKEMELEEKMFKKKEQDNFYVEDAIKDKLKIS